MPDFNFKPQVRSEVLRLVAAVPCGRVTSADALAGSVGAPPLAIVNILERLSEDERDTVPWHRVVAKGGAIGRGPHRDQQFARLVREGVMASPAGIVQDLARTMVVGFETTAAGEIHLIPPTEQIKPGGRSRGMKSRP